MPHRLLPLQLWRRGVGSESPIVRGSVSAPPVIVQQGGMLHVQSNANNTEWSREVYRDEICDTQARQSCEQV